MNTKWEEGQVYQCPVESCGCEITVTHIPKAAHLGDAPPTCCCGAEMRPEQEATA